MSSDSSPSRTRRGALRRNPTPTGTAIRDLAVVVAVVWTSVFVIRGFNVPEALAQWNRAHEQWSIDEVTLISLCTVAALGVFSWRRWRESLRVIARHQATLERLRTTEEEIEARDRLISSVSHELRTPLTGILGYAELLGSDAVDDRERTEMVERIIEQGWDLSHIVEDLLTRARVEAKALKPARVPVSLAAQAAQVLEGWLPDTEHRIALVGDGGVRALGDPARVRQIIRNLIVNAVRYGGPTIEIESGTRPGCAWLTVTDDGGGIPREHENLIFDPYHRLDPHQRAPGGLGLGLSISRQLACLMEGDLTYRRDGGRTVFELSLPLPEPLTPPAPPAQ